MENIMLKEFSLLVPELLVIGLAIISQLIAVFYKDKAKVISGIVILASLIVLFFMYFSDTVQAGFHVSFVISKFTSLFKTLVFLFTIISLISYREFCRVSGHELKLEFMVLVLLSAAGSLISISSRNFLLLFCGLELQALAGYALASFNINDAKSSEAGLKYFVLGALVSCLSLFGMSLIYGFGGGLDFAQSQSALINSNGQNAGLVIGLILMLSAIFFKLSAAPLHVWTPDVYEGAPTSAVIFFSTAQKIASLAVLINLLTFIIDSYTPISISLIKVLAITSMLVGALGAIRQNSLKRLMAYSTILNMGYMLIGVALGNDEGIFATIIYLVIYTASGAAFFLCLIAALGSKVESATFEDIKGISYDKKALAGAILIIMFSMIGIPPLAGFFGKYYLFYQAIVKGEILLASIGLGTSVIAAYYYLKVVKYIYFEEVENERERIPTNGGLLLITTLLISFILFFSLIPTDYLEFLRIAP